MLSRFSAIACLALCCGLAFAGAAEPRLWPLSASPLLLDGTSVRQTLSLTSTSEFLSGSFVLVRSSADLELSRGWDLETKADNLSIWTPPSAIPSSPVCYAKTNMNTFFSSGTYTDDSWTNYQYSPPTVLHPTEHPNTILTFPVSRLLSSVPGVSTVPPFGPARITGRLKFQSWQVFGDSAVQVPLQLMDAVTNDFIEPAYDGEAVRVPDFVMTSALFFQTRTVDLSFPTSYPYVSSIVAGGCTHILIQTNSMLKMYSFDHLWTMVRKSQIIPQHYHSQVFQNETARFIDQLNPYFDYNVSLAADDSTGGVFIAFNLAPDTVRLIGTMLQQSFNDSMTAALFWLPPTAAFSGRVSLTTDMIFVSAISVPLCAASVKIRAFKGRVVSTGMCYVGAGVWSQSLWIADISGLDSGQPNVTVKTARMINWDHRSAATSSQSVEDMVFLENGTTLLVAGSAGGDAFISLYNITTATEVSQVRFGVSGRANGATAFQFKAISAGNDPARVHTDSLNQFGFRVFATVYLNGSDYYSPASERYQAAAIYEVQFANCVPSASTMCVQSGYQPVVLPADCGGPAPPPTPPPSPPSGGKNVGVIAGAIVGSLAALGLMGFLGFLWNKKRQSHAGSHIDDSGQEATPPEYTLQVD